MSQESTVYRQCPARVYSHRDSGFPQTLQLRGSTLDGDPHENRSLMTKGAITIKK